MRQVQIRIEGQLDQDWSEWLGDLSIIHVEGNETVLTGKVKDLSALYGLIAKLRDLGVKLIAFDSKVMENGPGKPEAHRQDR